MNETMSTAVDICRNLIGEKTITTDSDIEDAINDVTEMSKFKDIDKTILKDELLSLYNVKVDEIQILEDKERRNPWLKAFKSAQQSEWKFWKRYSKYLAEQKRFAPSVISQLDDLTDKVLDKLFNPQLRNISICKKGLVVGQVQSGKTANYIGLVCKAADAGFNLIIILAGIHNNLRSQTQTRLDEGFLGFDTQYNRAYEKNKTTKIGVGKIRGFEDAIAHSYTTSSDNGDFTSRSTNTAGFNFNVKEPIILVVKKNSSVLKSLRNWLKTQSTNGKIDTKSMLMIDDEADNASINTNKAEKDPTAINRYIRDIINLFNRSAYVGYTATPFANIFIPLNDNDLFPRDFIINLPIPNNYIGPELVFGISADPDGNDELLPIVNTVTDSDNFVPARHKKDDKMPSIEDMPESLKIAIKCFIVTCAIRIARGQEKKHNSMLIHVTRYQVWQNHIRELVEQQFRYYKSEIEADDAGIMEEFRHIFEVDTPYYKSFRTTTKEILESEHLSKIDNRIKLHTWEEIKPLLYKAVQKIEVKSINGSSGDTLTYYENEQEGISVIAVGGDKLSRGLTLEGLSISYFLRASKMYDTLMQMGRWFGYRAGYVDLCRLFTSNELNEWFRHITLASDELREEFRYLAESGGTPDNYALKVRTHPGQLQITSLSKMRNAENVEVSWAGRLIETYQLLRNRSDKSANLVATKEFLNKLGNYNQVAGHNYLWTDISPETVCDYFTEFRLPKSLTKVPMDGICDYIRKLNKENELTSWNVVLMNKSGNASNCYEFSNGIRVGHFVRSQADDILDEKTYYIRKNHIVGNQRDEFIDLPKSLLEKARKRTIEEKASIGKTWDKPYPAPDVVRQEFRPKQKPLLIIYPLDPESSNMKDKQGNYIGQLQYKQTDEPFIGLAISFPSTDTNYAVQYAVNRVADFMETEDIFDDNNDNTYAE